MIVGAVPTPAFLPWLPGRAFALKGAGIGAAAGALLSVGFIGQSSRSEMLALTLFIMAISSYLAMNFTGSTPFTSPTGVEEDGCMECGACAINCPTAAIHVAPGVGCAAYIISGWIHGKENASCGGEDGCC